jgi:rhamnosyltransferase
LTFTNKLAAVVTTFSEGDTMLTNLERISSQVMVVIVVDDSGELFPTKNCDYDEIKNVVVLRNQDNLGIAAALNRGVEKAEALGCEWVITLDDDTLVSTTYVDDLYGFIYNAHPVSLGLVALRRDDGDTNIPNGENGLKFKRTLITSGCLFKITAFQKVGGFDEGLFIDLVDFDFCTKLRKSGLTIVLMNKVGMDHQVGNSRKLRLLGGNILIYNHSPFRLYYQMRNVFLFAKKHLKFDPLLCLFLLLDVIRLPLKALLYENQKLARFFYLSIGLRDGVLCREGRLKHSFRSFFK